MVVKGLKTDIYEKSNTKIADFPRESRVDIPKRNSVILYPSSFSYEKFYKFPFIVKKHTSFSIERRVNRQT